jgi:hypothetical protein
VPFAVVIKIVLREAGRPRRERMDAMRAADELEGPPAVIAAAPDPDPAPVRGGNGPTA